MKFWFRDLYEKWFVWLLDTFVTYEIFQLGMIAGGNLMRLLKKTHIYLFSFYGFNDQWVRRHRKIFKPETFRSITQAIKCYRLYCSKGQGWRRSKNWRWPTNIVQVKIFMYFQLAKITFLSDSPFMTFNCRLSFFPYSNLFNILIFFTILQLFFASTGLTFKSGFHIYWSFLNQWSRNMTKDCYEFSMSSQGQLQRWTEHSTLIFENLKPVEI